jgi:ABC-type Fe3+/spermidine/putrescine transport system ATPase subunit
MDGDRGLEVAGVSFSAGGKLIVDRVSLTARPGEVVALLGPSGCGKTTLLRLIAGLEEPSSGHISFDREDIARVAAHRRRFGMMFQDFALFPHLDVAKNVAFGLRSAEWRGDQRAARVSELLSLVGLAGYERRTTEALSGGERQRVALARALAPEPRMLMLDEPLGSLDRGLRERLLVELRQILSGLGIPAIYVTHDQYEAFAIADEMAIMRAGRIVRTGAPRAIYEDPQTEFVARFLGLENIIDATREASGELVSAAGRWFGDPAPAGAVRLLLRGEDVSLASRDEPGVLRGMVVSALFQGSSTRLHITTAAGALQFDVAAGGAAPPPGTEVSLSVPKVQVVEAEES